MSGTREVDTTSSDAFSGEMALIHVRISSENNAPVLDANATPKLHPILEDNVDAAGTAVRDTFTLDNTITDTDYEPLTLAPSAIAVVAVDDAHGVWQYSLDGGATWVAFDVVSMAEARLLDEGNWIRFVPEADFSGEVKLTFYAWDKTTGDVGGVAAIGETGGTSAF